MNAQDTAQLRPEDFDAFKAFLVKSDWSILRTGHRPRPVTGNPSTTAPCKLVWRDKDAKTYPFLYIHQTNHSNKSLYLLPEAQHSAFRKSTTTPVTNRRLQQLFPEWVRKHPVPLGQSVIEPMSF